MDVAVLVKQSLDVQELRVDPEGDKIYVEEAPTKVGDIELNAVEEAVRIKEKHGGKAVAVMLTVWGTSGKRMKEAREALTRVLAMGLDEAVLIKGGEEIPDTGQVARALAKVIREGGFNLVLAGEGSEDNFSGILPGRLAAELDWPFVAYATAVEIEGEKVRVTRSLEDYEEVVEVTLPAVISVTQEINKPRIPKLMEILKAKKKPVTELDFSPEVESKVRIEAIRVPRVERKNVILEGELDEVVEKLIESLKSEGVI